MTHRYDDIINLPHHVSQKHAPMARADRAAQFSPFAALTGLDAALRETARLTDQRITLDEYEQAALDETLQTVRDTLTKKEHPTVEVCYFVPDTRKAGGAYCTVTGVVKKMAEFEGLLIDMLNGSIRNKLPLFALPVAATAVLEQLFNAAAWPWWA